MEESSPGLRGRQVWREARGWKLHGRERAARRIAPPPKRSGRVGSLRRPWMAVAVRGRERLRIARGPLGSMELPEILSPVASSLRNDLGTPP